ncbi:hypothetical protein OR1_00400 [Geobacter sp. OR-1]|uniref:DUF1015 domain-containing protein n=1 Tax=Geobacter sp. OR-1 TaxID=1266765 RepID=UPI000542D7A7|nr:DUF1015 family protein [Geobacter sp. OR-1]GAM08129.1 hypothetical protein OR1_00400 [Geobacter sp. OR-1]
MAKIKPFRAVRPVKNLASRVAAPPYDVMDAAEAREMAAGEPDSFLHISRPEIDLAPDIDHYSEAVYVRGRENLAELMNRGVLFQDKSDCYYVYRQQMGDVIQTGLVTCASVDDYVSGVIKKHEHTRADKEDDRVRHIDYLDANDEPVFFTYHFDKGIADLVSRAASAAPEYDFIASDNVRHTFWIIDDPATIERLTAMFAVIPNMYVADGHHRSAAAGRVRDLRAAGNPAHRGTEEYNYFLAVIFPDNELNIMPYNRAVRDLNNLTVAEFMSRVAENFDVTPVLSSVAPKERHQFGMYLAGKWYELVARDDSFDETDTVNHLDVSILQNNLLNPVLGIRNPRTDQRIHFVGGIRGVEELVRLVDSGDYAVAFSLYPTSIGELISLADADKIMPPKSTWFEPKLRSGLFLHLLK